MDRPYMQSSGEEIRDAIDEHWDDFWKLGLIAYEMQFRRRLFRRAEDEERRAALIERLVELGVQGGREVTEDPGFDFPTTDVFKNRQLAIKAMGAVDWRETGLLRLSGYRVGANHGKRREERRRILNYIFLEDDLRDVTDREYKASWGAPKTSARLQKLCETLAAFARNAKRNPANFEQAISDWEEDLEYLRSTFYEQWGKFQWPHVTV